MRSPLVRSAALLLLGLGPACGGSHGAAYVEPKEPLAACPPPTLVDGGLDPAQDPGPVCVAVPDPVASPRTPLGSALPAAPPATFGWQDLGQHVVGSVVDVAVPPGTMSLYIVEQLVSGGPPNQLTNVTFLTTQQTQTQPNLAIIGELHDPAGKLLYTDLTVISGSDFSSSLLAPGGSGPVTGTVAYPSTSAGLQAVRTGGVTPGTWKVMVNDYAYECWLAAQATPPPGLTAISCDLPSQVNDAVYAISALTVPAASGAASKIPDRTTLDVAFHIVDTTGTPTIGVTAASAAGTPAIQRMVESLAWHFAGAGACLGTVTFYDEPDWAKDRFATHTSAGDADPCGNLPLLLSTSVPGQQTLELFLVPFLLSSPGDIAKIIGVDGTIPGPATINGTIASGAAVSAADLFSGTCPPAGSGQAPRPYTCGADLVAYVSAHEAGHYLGLYHPSEAGGDQFDPLVDTPHCECSSHCGFSAADCAAGISSLRCARADSHCAGGANLMFWQLGPNSQGYLSPEQAAIVRTSPVMRTP